MRTSLIKTIYLYLTSLVGLILIITALIQLTNIALSTYIFPKTIDQQCLTIEPIPNDISLNKKETVKNCKEYALINRQKQLIRAISELIVGIPLYLYHWSLTKKQK